MRRRRRTAARIIAESGGKLTTADKSYLAQPDKQDEDSGRTPIRTLAETGALYLKTRTDLGLDWAATGKDVGAARAAQGKSKPKRVKKAAHSAAAMAIPERADFDGQGAYLRACKDFKRATGMSVADARKNTPAVMTLSQGEIQAQIAALQAQLEADPS